MITLVAIREPAFKRLATRHMRPIKSSSLQQLKPEAFSRIKKSRVPEVHILKYRGPVKGTWNGGGKSKSLGLPPRSRNNVDWWHTKLQRPVAPPLISWLVTHEFWQKIITEAHDPSKAEPYPRFGTWTYKCNFGRRLKSGHLRSELMRAKAVYPSLFARGHQYLDARPSL